MKHLTRRTILAGAPAAISLAAPFLSIGSARAGKQYGPGVTDTEIKIGNIMPYSGPASAYGTIGKAEAAFFKMLNEQGGVNGRKIQFISYDDGYSPPKTVEQARKLVESDQVLLIFSSLGTATNTAIHQYMNRKKVPQLFILTGATKWGTRSTSLGQWVGYPITRAKRVFMPPISSSITPTGRLGCSIKTTITAKTM